MAKVDHQKTNSLIDDKLSVIKTLESHQHQAPMYSRPHSKKRRPLAGDRRTANGAAQRGARKAAAMTTAAATTRRRWRLAATSNEKDHSKDQQQCSLHRTCVVNKPCKSLCVCTSVERASG